MTKNTFALKCMEQVNKFGATQPGAPVITSANFDEDGAQLFICDNEEFDSSEMIEWFNIMFRDPDNIGDGMITPAMTAVFTQGITSGYIHDGLKTEW